MLGAGGNRCRDPPLNIVLTAGARPNFMKLAPLWKAPCPGSPTVCSRMIHPASITTRKCRLFFRDLGLPTRPLWAGPGSAERRRGSWWPSKTSASMKNRSGGGVRRRRLAAVTAETGLPVVHVEAGLQPRLDHAEETNRIVTIPFPTLFTPSGSRRGLLRGVRLVISSATS